MGILNLFKKNIQKNSDIEAEDILTPRVCPTDIPAEIKVQVDKVDWTKYSSAYGVATKTIPYYLKNLFCVDNEIAMRATHQLWCSLCHQQAYISTAALPAYDILKLGLETLNDQLKLELLDIFKGFAVCIFLNSPESKLEDWEVELKQKLTVDIEVFSAYKQSSNEDIAYFATTIVGYIENKRPNEGRT